MHILLGMPYYPGSILPEAFMAGLTAHVEGAHVEFAALGSTGTAKGFNALWANALSRAKAGELTHFAMLHADAAPEDGWLQALVDECQRLDAHLVSVVSPIKDDRGLTSTGCDWQAGNVWKVKRFTVRECLALPETFDTADTIAAGINPNQQPLLVNTCCWVADLRKPLWFQEDENGDLVFFFTMNDAIRWTGEKYEPLTDSEDWFLSRRLAAHGARYYATRKVQLKHFGSWAYRNDKPWGRWATDEQGPIPHCYEQIPGWFDFQEVYRDAVKEAGRDAHFVEVGSWLGRSTAYLAVEIARSGKRITLDAIDTWQGSPDEPEILKTVMEAGGSVERLFRENMLKNGLGNLVHPIPGKSPGIAGTYPSQSLDFVFIDGDHRKESVAADLAAWWPKVKPGGTLAGHDIDRTGVVSALWEFAKSIGQTIERVGNSYRFRKAAS